jgi:hypothetical protein
LNVHELDIILKSLELVESGDEIQINRSSGSIDTLYDRLYDYYATLDTTNVELNYESWYYIVKEDAPEVLDEFLENTAAKMEITVNYLMDEFL